MVFGAAGLFKDEALQEINATGQIELMARIMPNRMVLFKCSIRENQFAQCSIGTYIIKRQ